MMKSITTFILLTLAIASFGQNPAVYAVNNVAIDGYDPVAYFTEGAPVKGKKELSYSWNGTQWQFSSQANLDAFQSNPEKYAPQFGGFCAYGASENHKSPTQPDAFTIVDDKLYLNYNKKVKELWMKDTKGRIAKAEENWKTLKDQH